MSNQTFKIKLNNTLNIIFDFGVVESLPDTNNYLDISCICNFNNYFFIKNKNSLIWNKLNGKFIVSNITYGQDEANSLYTWNENILTINHNLNDVFLNVTTYGKTSLESFYSKIIVPNENYNENVVNLDFYGFSNYSFFVIIE